MRKSYLTNFTQSIFSVLVMVLLSVTAVNAQTDITIGTGTLANATTTYPAPLQDYYEGSRMQYLYLASELSAAGMSPGNVTAIKFTVTDVNTPGNIEEFTIKMGTTSTGSLTATSWETVGNALYGPATVTKTAGINTFTFTTPFFWNGTDNIVVEICGGDANNASTITYTNNASTTWTTGLSFNGSHNYRADNAGNLCGTATTTNTGTQTTRPNIIFSWIPALACTGTPNAGTVVATPSTVCLGTPFNLKTTGATVASGLTYQWQSSIDNVTFTDIPGATTSNFNTTQLVSTYYRVVVTCTSVGGGASTSAAVQVQSPLAVQGTFTINNNLPTAGSNFASFNDAYNYIKCGIGGPVIFNVDAASGPYTEQLIISEVPGASASNTVTFNGNGRVLQFTSTNTNERAVIKLDGADHFRFDSLNITALGSATGEYGFGIQFMNSADSNIINRCTININTTSTSTNYAGIVTSGSNTSATGTGTVECDFNQITNNVITGGYYGITTVSSSTTANRDYVIRNNQIREFYYYGMYVYGSYNIQIDKNELTRPTRADVSNFYGIYFTSLSTAAMVSNNRLHNAFGGEPTATSTFAAFYITSCDGFVGFENKFINNLVYNIGGAGDIYGIYNSSSDNVWFHHNTLYLDGDGAGNTASDFVRAFYQTGLAGGIQLKNNNFHINRGGLAVKHGFYYNTVASVMESDYNNIFFSITSSNSFTGHIGTTTGTDYISLADWQLGSGGDANSVSNNPLYEDATMGNFRPTNASIDNLGTALNVLTDITDLARSLTTPDIGAYEFTPGACTSPPTAGTVVLSVNPVCINTQVGLGVTGNSTGLGQTYQWESSPSLAGPWTAVSGSLTNPIHGITSTVSLYYRLAVTCSGSTVYSTPELLVVNPALPAGTYTINAGGSPSPTNFISFNAAYQAMACGIGGPIVLNVAPNSGPYLEQLIMDSIAGTSAVNTITFNGNGNTIQFSSDVTGERAVIKLRGVDHVTFDSLTIDANGTGTYGFGVHIIDNADSNTINNCIINIPQTSTSSNYAGLVISASETSATGTGATLSDGNTFSNNTVNGGYYSITSIGGTTSQFNYGNKIINNKVLDFYFYGIYLYRNSGILVEANELSRPSRTATSSFYGIYLTTGNEGATVTKNRLHDPFAGNPSSTSSLYGIYSTGSDGTQAAPNIISNNIIYNVIGGGLIYALYNSSSDFTKYLHNTILLDDQTYTGSSSARAFYMTSAADSVELKNNIFEISRTGSAAHYAYYISSSTYEFTADYNNIKVTGVNNNVGYNGANRATLADWKAATGQDANSLSTFSFFANPSGGNLRPMSPVLDNKGTFVGITDDIEYNTRSLTTPDIGAYEFTIPPCTAPPSAGATTATPNSGICLGTAVELSLSGNSIGSSQTYQWQFSTTSTGPWTDLGNPKMFPDTTIFASGTLYYRAAVTCSGSTTFSTPVLVSINPAFLSGYYTINPALPATLPNFQDFTTAVAALDCGITGFVTFDVASGIYNEKIRMHSIAGTGSNSRVTFRSASGNAADVTLTNGTNTLNENYTLQLDSASYISFQNMTISSTGTTYARAINFSNNASFDSITNCKIIVPNVTSTSNNVAGIFGDDLTGSDNVIKGNTISGGYAGIYFYGIGINGLTYNNVIDSNKIDNSYYYGMYFGYNGRIKVHNNVVNMSLPLNSSSYGIYSTNSDSAFVYTNNKINIDGATGTSYGMYFTASDASAAEMGKIRNNRITAINNGSTTYGMYNSSTEYAEIINNTISISTSGTTAYGSYVTSGGGSLFQNNTIVNNTTGTGTGNVGAYFSQTSSATPPINIQNNIFSALGGGFAYSIGNTNNIYSNYNTFYSSGANLVREGTTAHPSLQSWINNANWDVNSISIEPALISATDLRPDITKPLVWGIHGRGVQIPGNNVDILGNPRPTTITTGVPDMGAYEFLPTAQPTILTATPATPAPGITQTFMYGTDTVAKVTYSATAPVPTSISLQRYSGVLPTGLNTGQEAMYFYTKINVPAQGAYNYKMEQYYIDPWQGFIPTENVTKMGRTNAAGVWSVFDNSRTDINNNIITDTGVVYFDRYTGMTGSPNTVPPTPPYVSVIDSSNRGTRFWVPYGHHYSFNTNAQDMWLYLSAEDSANVTVRVNGTNWVRNYAIAANTVKVSDVMPKSQLIDSRITDEGLFDKGISITSDVPIVAYAHIYDNANSGATMLLPVGVYGYEYQSLNSAQYYPTGGAGSYSWTSVMTDRDSTLVEITPAVTTKAGRPAGVPFTVMLMQGQVYNIMGTINGAQGTDLSGTLVRSLANSAGKCYPIAVFSGSSRTAICNTTNGDNLIQQVFPSQAWGRKYLSFATANSLSNSQYNSNKFRIMVKDVNTVVNYNGAVLDPSTLQMPGRFYEVSTTQGSGTNGAIYVNADKPVMVAQYMVSTGASATNANGCPGITATGDGDPEMIYISPIEQGIKKVVFYNTDENSIDENYVNIVIPTAGLNSLTIGGISTFTDVFSHPFLPGYSGVRHNLGSTPGQTIVVSDSAFTAITYGLGSVESYGYNAGTLVKNLNALPSIVNTLGTGGVADYTCVGAPFRFNVLITSKPTVLTWKFSAIPSLTPNADVTQTNAVPVDSTLIGNRWYYRYTVNADYKFSQPGNFAVPILITDPLNIAGCDNTQEVTLVVKVIPAPVVNFTTTFSGCLGDPIQFNGVATTSNGTAISTYNWNFGNGTNSTLQNPSLTYAMAGTYNVKFGIVAADGCIADTTKPIVINPAPTVNVVNDSLSVCGGTGVTFAIANPVTGTSYNWYTDSTNATPVFTGSSYTVTNVNGTIFRYVRAVNASGCIGYFKKVTATVLPDLANPIVRVDTAGVDRLVFSWNPVQNAVSYEVSTDGGATWITPSSGATGLTHTVTGLQPLTEVTLTVRAKGTISCQVSVSAPIKGRTLTDQLFIPNAFSPNGDGLNDVLLVYGYTIKTMKFVVFNQWGEKIFESNNQATGWNGTYKNKPQPSGVYMYVVQVTLKDGSTMVKKGSINLVR